MPLARAWWRGSAWALAATLVVPGALAIAVATIALGGGLRSLGAVAQIVTGPEVPEAQLRDQGVARTTNAERPSRLPSVPRSAAAGATAIPAFRRPAGSTAPSPTRRTAPTGSTAPTPTSRRPATGQAPATTSQPNNAPATQSPPTTGPGQNDDVVRQTGKAAAGAVGA